MNLTEMQIKALPLEETQKLVAELRAIQPADRAYANAKAVIELITGDKKYKEPEMVKVTAVTNVIVDGREVREGQTVEILPWQHRALARFFEPLEMAKKGAAVALALALLSLLTFTASAQYQYTSTQLVGWNCTNAGSTTFTNYIAASGTSNYIVGITNTVTNVIPSVVVTNGTPVVTYVTNTVNTVSYPGTLNLTHWGQAALTMSCNLAATPSTNGWVQAVFDVSNDGLNWITNGFNLTVTNSGANYVGTWTNLTYLGAIGYIRLDTCSNNNTQALTNVVITLSKKPSLAGP